MSQILAPDGVFESQFSGVIKIYTRPTLVAIVTKIIFTQHNFNYWHMLVIQARDGKVLSSEFVCHVLDVGS